MENKVNYQERLINIVEFLSPKEIKKMKLDVLQRIITLTEEYTDECDFCKNSEEAFESIIQKIEQKDITYLKDIKQLKIHMLKKHRLLEDGHYTAIFLIYGLCIGVALGLILDNYSLFLAVGISLGIGVGMFLDYQARKSDKVL